MIEYPFSLEGAPTALISPSILNCKTQINFDQNETAEFDRETTAIEQEQYQGPEILAYFTVNPVVLRNASYGEGKDKGLIEKEIKNKLGIEDSHESSVSFNKKPDDTVDLTEIKNDSLDFGSKSLRSQQELFEGLRD